jgi:hypothetical protein
MSEGLPPDDDDGLALAFARISALPPEAVRAIFRRYGKPLAVAMPPPADDDRRAELEQPAGPPAVVRVLQVMGYGDVIPNDHFVVETPGEEPLAVSGPFFARALEALARAAGIA